MYNTSALREDEKEIRFTTQSQVLYLHLLRAFLIDGDTKGFPGISHLSSTEGFLA